MYGFFCALPFNTDRSIFFIKEISHRNNQRISHQAERKRGNLVVKLDMVLTPKKLVHGKENGCGLVSPVEGSPVGTPPLSRAVTKLVLCRCPAKTFQILNLQNSAEDEDFRSHLRPPSNVQMARKLRPRGQGVISVNAVKCRSMDLMKHGRDLRESIGYAMVDYLKFSILRGVQAAVKDG